MKNFLKLFGIIALVAVIGFSMAACGGDDGGNGNGNGTGSFNTDLVGKWENTNYGYFEFTADGTGSFHKDIFHQNGPCKTITTADTVQMTRIQDNKFMYSFTYSLNADKTVLTISNALRDSQASSIQGSSITPEEYIKQVSGGNGN